jgi:hypothetical protein
MILGEGFAGRVPDAGERRETARAEHGPSMV